LLLTNGLCPGAQWVERTARRMGVEVG